MSHTSAETVTKTESASEESAEQFFTLWTVFKRSGDLVRSGDAAAEFDALTARLAEAGVVHRGSYDVSAMRA
ncbi:MAG TPA: chlorite dismutase, partial [Arthrobacter sp.]|nr:chlorite dismutase [Arthrobacter sp.]